MPLNDIFDKRLRQLEVRRFVTQCQTQEPLIRRADTLRDVIRWANISAPYQVTEDYAARDALERIQDIAETRVKEIILGMIGDVLKSEPDIRPGRINQMNDDLTALTGSFRHLRAWGQKTLEIKQQQERNPL